MDVPLKLGEKEDAVPVRPSLVRVVNAEEAPADEARDARLRMVPTLLESPKSPGIKAFAIVKASKAVSVRKPFSAS